jgi:glycosyltransferase involved in cell wall biosynthesis/ADP-heptose:LPS heptosyltransferase
MQGAQSESRYRGIGRYSVSLAKAIIQNKENNDVYLLFNSLLSEFSDDIESEFWDLLPRENIKVCTLVGPVLWAAEGNDYRREIAESMREAFILSIKPDVVLITSLFEGMGDDSVTSIHKFDKLTPTATILYDLAPMVSPNSSLKDNPFFHKYYKEKLTSLKNSDLLLSISESSRQEGLNLLGFSPDRIVNISTGVDHNFANKNNLNSNLSIISKLKIKSKYVMYSGGADERKNLKRLIIAFSKLPKSLLADHNLLLAGKIDEFDVRLLIEIAVENNLPNDSMIFTGYIADSDLIELYKNCSLFVFPSLHEGFGIPPLEAMIFGAPVITSNAASLPEVIGLGSAMFNPLDIDEISNKIYKALTDTQFRNELIQNSKTRPKIFSWNVTARRAIKALESIQKTSSLVDVTLNRPITLRPSVLRGANIRILVIKLDHMGDFILAIPSFLKLKAKYPNAIIDIVVGSWNKDAANELNIFNKVYILNFFSKESFKGGKNKSEEVKELSLAMLPYDYAIDLRRQPDTRNFLIQFPSKKYYGYQTGNIAIDSNLSGDLFHFDDLPHLITPLNQTSIAIQMLEIINRLPNEPFDYININPQQNIEFRKKGTIAIFPKAGNSIKEWGDDNFVKIINLLALLNSIKTISIYFVDSLSTKPYLSLKKNKKINIFIGLTGVELSKSLSSHQICLCNNSYGAHLASYLGLDVVAIYGGFETVSEWAPIYGKPVIISTPTSCSPCHLPNKSDCQFSFKCYDGITPEYVLNVINSSFLNANGGDFIGSITLNDTLFNLSKVIAHSIGTSSEGELFQISNALAINFPEKRKKYLFIDLSEIIKTDAKTGIQRVTRGILNSLIEIAPKDFNIVPVVANHESIGYRYAKKYLYENFSIPINLDDDGLEIDFAEGDVFFGLDLSPIITSYQKSFYKKLKRKGVYLKFMVYDILPLLRPKDFPPGTEMGFKEWANTVALSDGVICISNATSTDFSRYINENIKIGHKFDIDFVRLGSDLMRTKPSHHNISSEFQGLLAEIQLQPSFLVVGTLEPRKGHIELLDAFDKLWALGFDINLIIVGKKGWLVNHLTERLRCHERYGSNLIWFENLADNLLEELYKKCSCLIIPSYAEGFGLPIVEASYYGLPIIARDIPIFKEVAGNGAFYFGSEKDGLEKTIKAWLLLLESGKYPNSKNIKIYNWNQCAEDVMKYLNIF